MRGIRFWLLVLLGISFSLPVFADNDLYSEEYPDLDSISVQADQPEATEQSEGSSISLIPMIGSGGYAGGWRYGAKNNISVGVGVDFPIVSLLSIEAEGVFEDKRFSTYTAFNKYQLWSFGANLKISPRIGIVRLSAGAGLLSLFYNNLRSFSYPYNSRWLGAGQFIGGADVMVTPDFGVGLRAAYVFPFINRLGTQNVYSSRTYQQDSITDSAFYRFMGTVTIQF